jgi:hypothetical protein
MCAIAGNYTVRLSGDPTVIMKQFLGDMHLANNGSIHLRAFGRLNLTLWDDILAEFEETYGKLTPRDIIMFNFGGWYVSSFMTPLDCTLIYKQAKTNSRRKGRT